MPLQPEMAAELGPFKAYPRNREAHAEGHS